jgi:hypothetical protein
LLFYNWASFFIGIAFVLLGCFVSLLVPVNLRDRKLTRLDGEWGRVRIWGLGLIRGIKGKGIQRVSQEQEDVEWNEYLDALREAQLP